VTTYTGGADVLRRVDRVLLVRRGGEFDIVVLVQPFVRADILAAIDLGGHRLLPVLTDAGRHRPVRLFRAADAINPAPAAPSR
jgi:hypothetical protein